MLRAAFILACALCAALAAPPQLEGFFPSGAQQGTTNVLTAQGKFDSWPPEVWVDDPGLQITATTNKGQFHLVVSGAAVGPHLIRFYNKEGASEPRFFMVNGGREALEAEPNDHFTNAQPVAEHPLVLNGLLNKRDDVDSFLLTLKKGETLHAVVESYTLMAKLDAALRLLTRDGVQLAWNHDHATLDPRLAWTAPDDQQVVLQMFGFAYPAGSEIRLAGGDGCHYRLGLFIRDEPAPAPSAQSHLSIPAKVRGALAEVGEEDVFHLPVRKDQWIGIEARARSIGSPLDAWLQLKGGDGKELARNDDADGSPDPALEWKSTLDGEVLLTIGALTRSRSPDFLYELEVTELQPDFRAVFESAAHTLKAGETNEIELRIERKRGHTNELQADFLGLPSGVRGICTNVPAKDGKFKAQLIAGDTVSEFQGPVVVKFRDTISGAAREAQFDLVSRSENNGVPGGYQTLAIPHVAHLWLTTQPREEKKEPQTAAK